MVSKGGKDRGSAPETPLNLSTKPKSKGIWSPASLCEEEQQQRSKRSPERSDSSSPDSSHNEHHPVYHHHQAAAAAAAMMMHQRNVGVGGVGANPAAAVSNLFRPFDPFTYVQQRSGALWRPSAIIESSSSSKAPVSPPDSSVGGRCHNQSGEESVACSFSSEEDVKIDVSSEKDHHHHLVNPPAHYCRGCDQSFSTHHGLQMHVRQNHCAPNPRDQSVAAGASSNGSGPFPCPRCPKVFEIGASLDQHLASHHAARSFQVNFT